MTAPTFSITDTFLAGGSGQNGLTATAYASSYFTSAPSKGSAVPGGATAAGSCTTASTWGNDGSFQITGLPAGQYWVCVPYSSTNYWKLYTVGGAANGSLLFGQGPPSNAVGNPGDQYVDQTTGDVYGPKAAANPPSVRASAIGLTTSVTVPAATQVGDLIFYIGYQTPTGYTRFITMSEISTRGVSYKVATSADPGATVSFTYGPGLIVVVSGADTNSADWAGAVQSAGSTTASQPFVGSYSFYLVGIEATGNVSETVTGATLLQGGYSSGGGLSSYVADTTGATSGVTWSIADYPWTVGLNAPPAWQLSENLLAPVGQYSALSASYTWGKAASSAPPSGWTSYPAMNGSGQIAFSSKTITYADAVQSDAHGSYSTLVIPSGAAGTNNCWTMYRPIPSDWSQVTLQLAVDSNLHGTAGLAFFKSDYTGNFITSQVFSDTADGYGMSSDEFNSITSYAAKNFGGTVGVVLASGPSVFTTIWLRVKSTGEAFISWDGEHFHRWGVHVAFGTITVPSQGVSKDIELFGPWSGLTNVGLWVNNYDSTNQAASSTIKFYGLTFQ